LLEYGHPDPPKPPASLFTRAVCAFCTLVLLLLYGTAAYYDGRLRVILMGLMITAPFVAMLSYRAITGRVLPGLKDRDWREMD
jgi:hypothetical protein